MDVRESGQGTPFESMSHEAMLAWLDKANSGAVKGASDRLSSAAAEIRKVATELRDRPQRVEWKGEGANAFQTWSADLANATLRLGDFSSGVSEWLAEASNAIATAQASIPRTHGDAQANLEAARVARNDPDASVVARKSAETLIATQEANRHEAAAQMRRLAQTYSFSAQKMDGLERPVFPPPPGAIVPERKDVVGNEEGWARSGGGSGSGTGYGTDSVAYSSTSQRTVSPESGLTGSPESLPVHTFVRPDRAVDMEIDGVATLPTQSVPVPPTAPPAVGKTDAVLPSGTTPLTPGLIGGSTTFPGPTGVGRPAGSGVRPPLMSGQSGLGTGPGTRAPRDGGITGGRPVAQSMARPAVGFPRGTVVGAEGTHAGRAPMGHSTGMGGAGGSQGGITGGRRLAGETGGLVGGRPQQSGRANGRPFTPGGTGLVRKSAQADGMRGTGPVGRAGTPGKLGEAGRDERDRPDYLVEDEETWQQGGRRVVPPVID